MKTGSLKKYKLLIAFLIFTLLAGQLYLPADLSPAYAEGPGEILQFDAASYQGQGATVTVNVYDPAVESASVKAMTIVPFQEYSPSDPSTYEVVYGPLEVSLEQTSPGSFFGSFTIGDGPDRLMVEDGHTNTILVSYSIGGDPLKPIDKTIEWIPDASIFLDKGPQFSEEVRGLGQVSLRANYFPLSVGSTLALDGISDNGTEDPADDLAFTLNLSEDTQQSWPGKSWVDFSGNVSFGTDGSDAGIPVNPSSVNWITLEGKADGQTIAAELIWLPAQFDIDEPEGGYIGIKDVHPQIELFDTGINTTDRVVVNGVSTSVFGSQEFMIVLQKNPPSPEGEDFGNFSTGTDFVPKDVFVQQALESMPRQIPVDPKVSNTIDLTFEQNGVEFANSSFVWNPDASSNPDPGTNPEPSTGIWRGALMGPGFYTLSENPSLEVKITDFLGNAANLKVELRAGETGELVAATLSNTVVQSSYPPETAVRFTASGEEASALTDPIYNNKNLRVKLLYRDLANPSLDADIWLSDVRIDNLAPGAGERAMGIQFDSMGTGEYAGLYRFKIYLEDEFNTSPLAENFVLKRNGSVVADAYKAVVPVPPQFGGEGPYREVYLYLSNPQNNDVIEISNLTDFVGHTMAEPENVAVRMETAISGSLTDGNGAPIPNAAVVVIPYSTEKGLDLENIRRLNTDYNGNFSSYYLSAGTYRVMSAELDSNTSEPAANSYYLDAELTIPVRPFGESYDLNLQLPSEQNVSGKVARAEGELYPEQLIFVNMAYLDADYEDVEELYYNAAARVATAPDGSFNFYLPPGQYKLVGRAEGMSLVAPTVNVVFTVPSAGTVDLSSINISFPEHNVFGTIRDGNGNTVSNAAVAIVNTDVQGEPQIAYTGENGSFGLALADGNYRINGVMVLPYYENKSTSGTVDDSGSTSGSVYAGEGFYQMDVAFSVTDNQVVNVTGTNLDQGGTTLDDIVLPEPNVTVKLVENGIPVTKRGELTLVMASLLGAREIGVVGMGSFNFYLSPGTYRFSDVELFEGGFREIELDEEVTVDSSTNLTGDNALVFDIQSSSNVVISFKDAGGNAAGAGYGLSIEKDGGAEYYWNQANAGGQVYLQLAPGTYRINGYDKIEGEFHSWQQLDQKFTVTAEHNAENKLAIDIAVLAPNVQGVVEDENGNPIAGAWVNVKRMPESGEVFPEYKGFRTNESGQFSTSLRDGTYVVEGVSTSTTWIEMNFKFYVLDGEVHLLPDGSDTVTEFIISKPEANVRGYVYKTPGVPFAPVEGWTDGQPTGVVLHLREMVDEGTFNSAPWLYQKWVDVKDDGSFGVTLEEGKSYAVFAISTPRRWIELDITEPANQFTVPDTDLVIMPAVPNFSGTVKNLDGSGVGRGWLGIESADHTRWFGTEVDENGSFGTSLAPGRYLIREYSFEVENENGREYRRMVFNKTITVPENSPLTLELKPNFTGAITLPLDTSSEGKAGVIIRQVLAEGDPDYSDWQQNPWQYESWFELDYNEGTKTGTFTGYLEDGDELNPKSYQIAAIAGPGFWTELKENIVLGKTSSGNIAYNAGSGVYTLTLNHSPNVTGIVSKGLAPVANAWVNIEEIQGGVGVNYFGANTNGAGQFGLKLADGDYRVTGYSTPGQWSGNNWTPGQWVAVNYPFKVAGGELREQNGAPLAALNIGTNVAGIVQRYVNGNLTPVSNAWVTIKPELEDGSVDQTDWSSAIWANAGANGEFALMLAPGNYRVVQAGGENYWAEMSIRFAVDGSGLAAGANVEDGKLLVKPQLPNVKGTAYDDNNQVVARGWVLIKPASAAENDWQFAKWINTDANGKFAIYLPDGNWKISEISSPTSWFKVNIPFTVAGSTVTSAKSGVVVSNELNVRPAQPNVIGVLYDSSNALMAGEAWVTVKPASAGTNDYQNALWAEYKLYGANREFRMSLEPGTYRVTDVNSPNGHYLADTLFTVNPDGTVTSSAVESGKLAVRPPAPNVDGTIYRQDDPSQVMANAWVEIIRVDASGNQVTMEGEALPPALPGMVIGEVRWEYARGISGNADGTFSLRLPAGTFKVIGAGGEGGWYRPNLTFEVPEGESVSNLEIKPPTSNVTITVQNTGLADNDAWINVKDSSGRFIPVSKATKAGDSYVFSLYLPNGSYQVESFGTPNFWSEVRQEFSVAAAASVTVDFSARTTSKVRGTITGVSEQAWVAIQEVKDGTPQGEKRWIQANNGIFEYEVKSGEEWTITDVSTVEGYYTTDNLLTAENNESLYYSYLVGAAGEQAPSEWEIPLGSLFPALSN